MFDTVSEMYVRLLLCVDISSLKQLNILKVYWYYFAEVFYIVVTNYFIVEIDRNENDYDSKKPKPTLIF